MKDLQVYVRKQYEIGETFLVASTNLPPIDTMAEIINLNDRQVCNVGVVTDHKTENLYTVQVVA